MTTQEQIYLLVKVVKDLKKEVKDLKKEVEDWKARDLIDNYPFDYPHHPLRPPREEPYQHFPVYTDDKTTCHCGRTAEMTHYVCNRVGCPSGVVIS